MYSRLRSAVQGNSGYVSSLQFQKQYDSVILKDLKMKQKSKGKSTQRQMQSRDKKSNRDSNVLRIWNSEMQRKRYESQFMEVLEIKDYQKSGQLTESIQLRNNQIVQCKSMQIKRLVTFSTHQEGLQLSVFSNDSSFQNHKLNQQKLKTTCNNPKGQKQPNKIISILKKKQDIGNVDLMNGLTKASRQNLQQAICHLKIHNKNMMNETKRTVQEFQHLIQNLLQTNAKLQYTVLEYEDYIKKLENQNQKISQQDNKNKVLIQKLSKQKLSMELYFNNMTSKLQRSESDSTINQNDKVFIHALQLQQKDKMIEQLENLIKQKQATIKKMAIFNNQMCLDILELKKKMTEKMISHTSVHFGKSHRIQVGEIEMQIEKQKITKKLIQDFQEIKCQNFTLKELNENLVKQLKEYVDDDNVILLYIERQAKIIQILQQNIRKLVRGDQNESKKAEKITQNQKSKPNSGRSLSSDKKSNLGSLGSKTSKENWQNLKDCDHLIDLLTEQITAVNNNQANTDRIMYINSQKKSNYKNFYKNLQHREVIKNQRKNQNLVILKKVDNILKILLQKVTNSQRSEEYNNLLNSIKSTVKKIGEVYKSQDQPIFCTPKSTISKHKQFPSQQDRLSLQKLDNKLKNSLLSSTSSSYISRIGKKNHQIFSKVKQMKQRMKTYKHKQQFQEEINSKEEIKNQKQQKNGHNKNQFKIFFKQKL